jgi:hypothetical protein
MPVIDFFNKIEDTSNSKKMSEVDLVIYSIVVGDRDPLQIMHRPRGSAEKFVSLKLQKIMHDANLNFSEDNRSMFRKMLNG